MSLKGKRRAVCPPDARAVLIAKKLVFGVLSAKNIRPHHRESAAHPLKLIAQARVNERELGIASSSPAHRLFLRLRGKPGNENARWLTGGPGRVCEAFGVPELAGLGRISSGVRHAHRVLSALITGDERAQSRIKSASGAAGNRAV